MLNGIQPILLFQFYKIPPAVTAALSKIPLISERASKLTFAVIPIYLSDTATGLFIVDESKNIDIDTTVNGLSAGGTDVQQNPISSITTINMEAKKDSLGLTILFAMAELIIDKALSAEYEITYLNGPVTIFGGLIHSLSFDQEANSDKCKVKLEISRGARKPAEDQLKDTASERLQSTGTVPPANAPTVTAPAGPTKSVIVPGQT